MAHGVDAYMRVSQHRGYRFGHPYMIWEKEPAAVMLNSKAKQSSKNHTDLLAHQQLPPCSLFRKHPRCPKNENHLGPFVIAVSSCVNQDIDGEKNGAPDPQA